MLLLVDVGARGVLRLVEPLLFGGAHVPVLEIVGLHAIDVLLLAFEPARFLRVQLAGLQALLDALLLVDVTLLIFFRHGIGESSAAQQCGHRESQCDLRLAHGGCSSCLVFDTGRPERRVPGLVDTSSHKADARPTGTHFTLSGRADLRPPSRNAAAAVKLC